MCARSLFYLRVNRVVWVKLGQALSHLANLPHVEMNDESRRFSSLFFSLAF